MPNPFSGDTTTTGARAGNDTYDNLTSEATDETNAIAAIPGSIGGTIAMNSGCYGYEISNFIISVDVLTLDGELKSFNKDQIKFFYRCYFACLLQ